MDTLSYLETCDTTKLAWRKYVTERSGEVKAEINSLRRQARQEPGRIAAGYNEMALNKERRLNILLARCAVKPVAVKH